MEDLDKKTVFYDCCSCLKSLYHDRFKQEDIDHHVCNKDSNQFVSTLMCLDCVARPKTEGPLSRECIRCKKVKNNAYFTKSQLKRERSVCTLCIQVPLNEDGTPDYSQMPARPARPSNHVSTYRPISSNAWFDSRSSYAPRPYDCHDSASRSQSPRRSDSPPIAHRRHDHGWTSRRQEYQYNAEYSTGQTTEKAMYDRDDWGWSGTERPKSESPMSRSSDSSADESDASEGYIHPDRRNLVETDSHSNCSRHRSRSPVEPAPRRPTYQEVENSTSHHSFNRIVATSANTIPVGQASNDVNDDGEAVPQKRRMKRDLTKLHNLDL